MKQILLICAVVAVVGGCSPPPEGFEIDPNIEAAIRRIVEKPSGNLTESDFGQVKVLDISHNLLHDLKGLDKLENLEELGLSDNLLTGASFTQKNFPLKRLNMKNNQLTEVNLESLINLEILDLSENQLKEVKGLDKLTNLKYLNLSGNLLNDIDLSKLTRLEELDMAGNQLRRVKGIEQLKSLKTLNLGYNQLTKLKPLKDLRHLERLCLISNPELTKSQIFLLESMLPKCKIEID